MEDSMSHNQAIAWRPTAAVLARARLTQFLRKCSLSTFRELHTFSVEDIAGFTSKVLNFLGIQFDAPYETVLDLSPGPAWARWCVGGKMNITETCLDRHLVTESARRPALLWEGEEGPTRALTYSELAEEVSRCAAGLRALGLKQGDAIAIHLPMIPETVIALLAISRIGAVSVPLFSGYGPTAIRTRIQDVEAKAIICCDGFPRRGRMVPAKPTVDQALEECPSVRHAVVVRRAGRDGPMKKGRDLPWVEMVSKGQGGSASTGADDPLMILYTSGTTGRPKGIVHTHCSFPIKGAQDMAFGTDVGPGDRILWVTDLGWMMGPWLIYGALILGATMVLYDGALDHPAPDRLWSVCAKNRVGILGVSPTLIRTLSAHGDQLPAQHDLSSLRVLASTGEPWNPRPWWWLFEKVGRGRLPIINYSGGTEISGGILMGNPLLPVKPCAFSAPCPGIAADVWDEGGNSVRGTVGELVIKAPWIGMARGFWKDPHRYLETYWSRWPDTWVHGDWAMVDEDDQWFILGRSDDTFKVAGKRVGPAEVESILVGHRSVAEAAAIGIPDEIKGTALVGVCVLHEGIKPGMELSQELLRMVSQELGKPLRPKEILFVPALPKTRNAKVMRRVIVAAYLGENAGDVSALDNPEAVDAIRRAAESCREEPGK